MAEGDSSDEFPGPSTALDNAMILLNRSGRDAAPRFILDFPEELIVNIIKSLIPTQDHFNPTYIGSHALRKAMKFRRRMWKLCQVCRLMNKIATQYLYQIVVVLDSNEFACLQRTLREDSENTTPELCGYIQSLAVHQNIVSPGLGQERGMTAAEFSATMSSLLKKLPRLSRFSLVPTEVKVHLDSHPCAPVIAPLALPQMPKFLT